MPVSVREHIMAPLWCCCRAGEQACLPACCSSLAASLPALALRGALQGVLPVPAHSHQRRLDAACGQQAHADSVCCPCSGAVRAGGTKGRVCRWRGVCSVAGSCWPLTCASGSLQAAELQRLLRKCGQVSALGRLELRLQLRRGRGRLGACMRRSCAVQWTAQ